MGRKLTDGEVFEVAAATMELLEDTTELDYDRMPECFRQLTGRALPGVFLVAQGLSGAEVGRVLGMSRWAVRNWLTDPYFVEALDHLKSSMVETGRRKLTGLIEEAVDTLSTIMRDEEATDASRVRAATAILDRVGLVRGTTVELGLNTSAVEPLMEAGREVMVELALVEDSSDDEDVA